MNTKFGHVYASTFSSPFWCRNAHIQTIWPRFCRRLPNISWVNERITTPDNDFLDLAWCFPSQRSVPVKALVIIFHGLEGSAKSHYVINITQTLLKQNMAVVLMHYRGCSGEANLTHRAYHSGETSDPLLVIEHVKAKYPHLPLMALGYSLGGNMLLKLLGENPKNTYFSACVAVSAPLKLAECAQSIKQGFAKQYERYLLKSMRRNLLIKMHNLDYTNVLPVSASQVEHLSSFEEFDHLVTAPLHGFKSGIDYYEQNSAFGLLKNIDTPTLILHAKDDPFMNHRVIPSENEISQSVAVEVSKNGGHVGFMQGAPWASTLWLPKRILAFFNAQLVK